jgi:hypothetical protein
MPANVQTKAGSSFLFQSRVKDHDVMRYANEVETAAESRRLSVFAPGDWTVRRHATCMIRRLQRGNIPAECIVYCMVHYREA